MSKLGVTGPLWGEICQWPLDSPHKGPVMRKAFSCPDVIMWLQLGFKKPFFTIRLLRPQTFALIAPRARVLPQKRERLVIQPNKDPTTFVIKGIFPAGSSWWIHVIAKNGVCNKPFWKYLQIKADVAILLISYQCIVVKSKLSSGVTFCEETTRAWSGLAS